MKHRVRLRTTIIVSLLVAVMALIAGYYWRMQDEHASAAAQTRSNDTLAPALAPMFGPETAPPKLPGSGR